MPQELVELRNVSKRFAGVSALSDISIDFRGGEIHCIAGQNGSGKSTLIKVVSGVHAPDGGEIRVDGHPTSSWGTRDAIAAGIQVIYQDFSLFPNLTVAENLALGRLINAKDRIVSRSRMRAIATRAVALLGVNLDLDAEVGALPVSGKQLVAIARALMSEPRLLIMDEPTTALTGQEITVLFKVVRAIREQGVAVVFVSHKMREMLEISDRLTVLRGGKVVAAGPVSQFDETSITHAMTGADHAQERYTVEPGPASVPCLELRNVSVGDRLSEINLKVFPGEIVGVSGLLGAGRTELALTIFGMEPSYIGAILIDGTPVTLHSIQAAVDNGIAYVPEDRLSDGLFFGRTIAGNVLSAKVGTSKQFLLPANADAIAAGMLRDMRINAAGNRLVEELSGGNQQRVILGRWLLTRPRVLLLNGPSVGVDVGAKAEIHKVIRRLAENEKLGVLMISDDVDELLQNCNRMVIMHHGRIVEEFATGQLREEDISERLRALP